MAHDLAALPASRSLVEDADAYDRTARELLANGGVPRRAFYQDPLYPYFLAGCYAVLGPSYERVRALQALLGGAAAVLLALAGRRLGGRACGVLSGAGAAAYAPLLFHSALLGKEALLVVLEAAFIALALAAVPGRRPGVFAAAGLALGAAVLLRANLLLLAPLATLWWVREAAGLGAARRRSALPGMAAFLGFVALPIAPVTWLNHRAAGELVLTTTQAGANFYIGNSRGATGTYRALVAGRESPEQEQEDARRLAAAIVSRERGSPVEAAGLPAGEVSRALLRESRREIAAAPGAWLRLLGWKLLLFWNAYELPDAESLDVYRTVSPWLRWNPIGFGAVAPLGLVGLVVLWRLPAGRFLAWMAAGVCASVVLFYVLGRYRLAVVPLLLPAAAAVLTLGQRLRERRAAALARLALGLLVAAALVHLPLADAATRHQATAGTHYNQGLAALRLARAAGPAAAPALYAEAERHLQAALAAHPGFVEAGVEIAVARLRRAALAVAAGRHAEAAADYDAARRWLAEALAHPGMTERPVLRARVEAGLLGPLERGRVVVAAAIASERLAAADAGGAAAAIRAVLAAPPLAAEAAVSEARAALAAALARLEAASPPDHGAVRRAVHEAVAPLRAAPAPASPR